MNNRSGIQVKALGLLGKKYEAFIRAERKRIKRTIKMTKHIVLRQLEEDEADRYAMKLFGCNADEARKILSTN